MRYGGGRQPSEVTVDPRKYAIGVVLAGFLVTFHLAVPARARAGTPDASAPAAASGVHDFDWDIGTWKTHQRRLLHPLTGSTTWVDYTGTDVVEKIWDGANRGKIEATGSSGSLEIFTVRLYDPDARQWRIYFTPNGSGAFGIPVVGEFANGRGEFYDQEPYKGKMIWVRFRVHDITANSCEFDQAFSDDGGKTWETNFIVSETRA